MLDDVCLEVNPVGKPDAVAPHVRFDERGRETGLQCYRARPRLYRDRWASFPLPLEFIRCKNTNYLHLLSAFRRHPSIVARLLVTSGQIKALSI